MVLPKRQQSACKERKRKQCLTQLKGGAGIPVRGPSALSRREVLQGRQAKAHQPPVPVCVLYTKHIESQRKLPWGFPLLCQASYFFTIGFLEGFLHMGIPSKRESYIPQDHISVFPGSRRSGLPWKLGHFQALLGKAEKPLWEDWALELEGWCQTPTWESKSEHRSYLQRSFQVSYLLFPPASLYYKGFFFLLDCNRMIFIETHSVWWPKARRPGWMEADPQSPSQLLQKPTLER